MGFNKKRHLEDNILAIRTVFDLEKRGAKATTEEIKILKKYKGFGGLKCILQPCESSADKEKWSESEKDLFAPTMMLYDIIRQYSPSDSKYIESVHNSVLTAFYTPSVVVYSIMKALADAGIKLKKVLEPSAGTGAFTEIFKKYTDEPVTCFEKDILTGKILQYLYPEDYIHNAGFETITNHYCNYFDGVISNIPFGQIRVFDSSFLESKDAGKQKSTAAIHNYFFLKAVEVTREGGIIAFITSQGVLNSPRNEYIRQWLMERCHLLSAIRLPCNLFMEEANTEVSTDLIVLQKDISKHLISTEETNFIHTRTFDNGYSVNNYFMDFSHIIHTQAKSGKDPYGKPSVLFTYNKTIEELATELYHKLSDDLKQNFSAELYENGFAKEEENDLPEPLISLYDLFGIPVEERNSIHTKHKSRAKSTSEKNGSSLQNRTNLINPLPVRQNELERKPYHGDMPPYYKNGTIICQDDMYGTLTIESYMENDREKFNYYLNPLPFTNKEIELLNSYMPLRNNYFDLFHYEYTYRIANSLLRDELNQSYLRFTEKHGGLNKKENHRLISKDNLGGDILALEYDENGTKKIADIFTQPVSFAGDKPKQFHTSHEALADSLNKYGYVNLEYMLSVLSKTREEMLQELKGHIYYHPLVNQYEVAARFVAGDVIEKGDAIEKHMGEHPELDHMDEARESLEVLRKATPEPIPFEELDFNLGERWIPASYYGDYASGLFGTKISITYFIDIDNFLIEAENPETLEITEKWAVNPCDSKKVTGLKLFTHALVNTFPKITKGSGKYYDSGVEIRVPDVEAIQQANAKIDEMRTGFMDWLSGKSQDRKKELAALYNRKFNARVIPKYDGRFQTYPGLHLDRLRIPKLYDSQYNSVWQGILNEGVIVDNSVGTGKSLTMCIIAHELKRLKLVENPLLMCLKTNVTSIAEHFTKAYPGAKILFPSEKDFQPKNRKRLFYKMQNSNWDAIILTHEQFFKLPQSLEVERDILQKELDSVTENLKVWERINKQSTSKGMLKGLQQRKENLSARLKWIHTKMNKRRDEVIDFKTMGIDHILVDESQEFKNLCFDTRYRNVAGLGDPQGSQRALNLLFAIRTIQQQKKKDMCSTFLTATTISNSLVELYLIFKYLRPQALEAQGIRTFDAWAAVYAKKTSDFEFTVTGEIKSRERFRYFKNVPELALFYNEITNFSTAKDIQIDKPESNIVLFTTKSTPEQDEFQEKLIEFARTGKGELIGRPDISYEGAQSGRMLVVTDLARKAAVDMRLIDPEKYHDHPDNKISQACRNIAEAYYKYNEFRGTQMVICDIGTYKPDKWNVYSEMKRKLVEQYHLPAHEIRFIQEARNMDQRDRIKEDFRAGIIRVLIGHTKSLGTAMDVPDRGVKMHSLNMPWTPKDLEQRDGRLARKGNWLAKLHMNNTVDHVLYASENSLDTYMFNLLQNKQTFITQLKTNSLGTRTLDEGAMDSDGSINYSEYVAILSGNTDLLEKVKMERRITVLESECRLYNKQLIRTGWKLEKAVSKREKQLDIVRKLEQDWKYVEEELPLDSQEKRPNPIRLNSLSHNDNPEEIGWELNRIKDTYNTNEDYYTIGSLLKFKILVKSEKTYSSVYNRFFIEGGLKYTFNHGNLSQDPMLAAGSFIRALDKIPSLILQYKENLPQLNQDIKVLEEIIGTPWNKESELKRLKVELDALERKIQAALTKVENNHSNEQESEMEEIKVVA